MRDVSIARWLGLLFLASTAVYCAACSPSALRVHVHAAPMARSSLDVAAGLGEAACAPERSARMAREGVSSDEHEAHVRRCERAKGAHALAVAAWVGYVGAVLEAASGGRVGLVDVLRWSSQLTTLYHDTRAALAALGVDAPDLPSALGGDQ
jgi:hypothetical protein